jgi:uncharacterized protein (DUF1778 family)
MSTVVGARFSDIERAQVEAAAGRLGLNLSGFVRQAALQASAVVGKKAVVYPPRRRRQPRSGSPAGSFFSRPG